MGENTLKQPMENLEGELSARSYRASISVLKEVIPYLREDDEVRTRLEKSVKTISMLVAADVRGSDESMKRSCAVSEAMRRCRETVVMLSYCRDLHDRFINRSLCEELISIYRYVSDALVEFGSVDRDPQEVGSEQAN